MPAAFWRKSIIDPAAKKPSDYRPVARTLIVMKYYEKYMVSALDSALEHFQFAYRHGRIVPLALSPIWLLSPWKTARLLQYLLDLALLFCKLHLHVRVLKLKQMFQVIVL